MKSSGVTVLLAVMPPQPAVSIHALKESPQISNLPIDLT
jgi:hypothetical protein